MKPYSIIINSLLILVSLSVQAQDVTLFESETYDDNMVNIAPVKIDGGYISLIVESKERNWEDPKMNPLSIFNKDFNYTYIPDENNVYLSKMDMDLNIIAETKLLFDDAHDLNIYGMYTYDGQTTLYYSQRKNFNNEVYIYSMNIDTKNLKKQKKQNIHTIRSPHGIPATRLIVSPDSTKLAFISQSWLGDNDEVKLDIALINIQGTPIWSDPVYLDATSERISITDAVVDNTGNIYLSYKLFDKYRNQRSKKNKKGEKIPAYDTRIITFGLDETEAYVTINDQDKFVRKCDLIYNDTKGKVQAVGTYSIKDGGNLSGVFFTDIDPTSMKAKESKFYKFDKKLISLIKKDGFGQTKNKDPGIEIRTVETNIHIKKNGDIVYIIQPYKYEERYINNGFRNSANNVESGHNIFSIILAQITDSNVLYTRIPRRSNYLSQFGELIAKTLIRNDQIYLLYTDYYKNLERRDDEKPKTMRNPSHSSLVLANVNSEGNYYRSFLKNRAKEENFSLSMSDFQAINRSEYMFTSYIGGLFSNKRNIGTVSFN
ncbi:hypothetical protein N9C25_03980 [Saprospiraceae bacterium]|nr:hypothetical protein [Saprospiraceae bacterium]